MERVKALTRGHTITCTYDEILTVMAEIMQVLKLDTGTKVYLYEPIRKWAIAQLMAK